MKWLKILIWKYRYAKRYYELCGYLFLAWECAGIAIEADEDYLEEDPEDMAYEDLTADW